MTRRARPRTIPQRRRVFLGCEGESERGYGALLQRLADARALAIHIHPELLKPGAGDPLALVELAIQKMRETERRASVAYISRAILLDSDRRNESPQRYARMARAARSAGLRLIWQNPCHEALLLRHIDGCSAQCPATVKDAERELRRRWPEYRKPAPAAQLATQFTWEHVSAACRVESDLADFLDEIGLVRRS